MDLFFLRCKSRGFRNGFREKKQTGISGSAVSNVIGRPRAVSPWIFEVNWKNENWSLQETGTLLGPSLYRLYSRTLQIRWRERRMLGKDRALRAKFIYPETEKMKCEYDEKVDCWRKLTITSYKFCNNCVLFQILHTLTKRIDWGDWKNELCELWKCFRGRFGWSGAWF